MTLSKNILKASVAALLLSFTLTVPAFAEDDVVVARVNNQEIKKSDVMREMASLPPQLQQMPMESLYPQLLERMIDTKLLLAEGYAQKINESEDFKQRAKRAEERIITDMALRSKVKPMVTEDKVKARYDAIVSKSKVEEEVRRARLRPNGAEDVGGQDGSVG